MDMGYRNGLTVTFTWGIGSLIRLMAKVNSLILITHGMRGLGNRICTMVSGIMYMPTDHPTRANGKMIFKKVKGFSHGRMAQNMMVISKKDLKMATENFTGQMAPAMRVSGIWELSKV